MVDSVSLSFRSLSLKSLSSAVRQTVDGPHGLAGGEDNIWKLIQFLPLCTALQSANTATGWCKEMAISIYILHCIPWRVRLEPYGRAAGRLPSVEVWPLQACLLTRLPLCSTTGTSYELSKVRENSLFFLTFHTTKGQHFSVSQTDLTEFQLYY